jgi:predicted transcriptional regulator
MYLELHQWQIGEIKKSIVEADKGDFVPDREMDDLFTKLTGQE